CARVVGSPTRGDYNSLDVW
nr:immunoglobulin heavy chain junction region [Macaca mulatta]MOV46290.1 immunoglobulin heavy chain junction region [Macaca mulatta]